jgi:hypothetical protein
MSVMNQRPEKEVFEEVALRFPLSSRRIGLSRKLLQYLLITMQFPESQNYIADYRNIS